MEEFIGPDTLLGRALTPQRRARASRTRSTARACTRPRSRPPTASPTPARCRACTRAWSAPWPTDRRAAAARPRRSTPPGRRRPSGDDRCLTFETTFGLGFFTASLFAPYGVAGQLRPLRRGRLGRLRRSREPARVRVRHEQDGPEPVRRPPHHRAGPGRPTTPSASSPPTCRCAIRRRAASSPPSRYPEPPFRAPRTESIS